jgi:hypothetical protein
MSDKPDPTAYRDSAVGWFTELFVAAETGDFARAVAAQAQLARLGWRVRRLPYGETTRRPA